MQNAAGQRGLLCPREALCSTNVPDKGLSAISRQLQLHTASRASAHRALVHATQITYDLNQVAPAERPALRDFLVRAMDKFHGGPRSVLVQVCLALAGLALQLPEWQNPVQDILQQFGANPIKVPALLQFLTLLPEEMASNTKIPITVRLTCTLAYSGLMTYL